MAKREDGPALVAAGMIEAAKDLRKLKAHGLLPLLRAAVIARQDQNDAKSGALASMAASRSVRRHFLGIPECRR